MTANERERALVAEARAALGTGRGEGAIPREDPAGDVEIAGAAAWTEPYPVTALAASSLAAVALALAELVAATGEPRPAARVRRGLAEEWFRAAVRPVGWEPPPPWDPIAGDYATADGWIRLHTNAPHHRAAALRALGADAAREEPAREEVAQTVAARRGEELEAAVVAEGGCAAVLRSPAQWAAHPQGRAVAREPLVARRLAREEPAVPDGSGWEPRPGRPLAGLRVLDLTRVLAGPVATRLLAGLGARVLRVDPPGWEEPALEPDMTLGKRCARLELRDPAGRERLLGLLAEADVLVHGYRSDALERLGLGEAVRAATRPGLVDVALDAYGWTGPWARRRGFDSLVQMSSGIAAAGMLAGAADRPTPLPVQALDHATGCLAAAAVLAGLRDRLRERRGSIARLSLARTALSLERARALGPGPSASRPAPDPAGEPGEALGASRRIATAWGPAELVAPPLAVDGVELAWELGPRPLGSDEPRW